MNNVIQFPSRQKGIETLKYHYKLYYLEDDDSWWTQLLDAKTQEWGEWVKLKSRGEE